MCVFSSEFVELVYGCSGLFHTMFQVEPSGALELECVFVSSLVFGSGNSIWNFISHKVRDSNQRCFKQIHGSLIVWGIFRVLFLRTISSLLDPVLVFLCR